LVIDGRGEFRIENAEFSKEEMVRKIIFSKWCGRSSLRSPEGAAQR